MTKTTDTTPKLGAMQPLIDRQRNAPEPADNPQVAGDAGNAGVTARIRPGA